MLGSPAMTATRDKPVLFAVAGQSGATAPSDTELVERVRAGDRRAEEAIYNRYAAYVASLCLRMLRDREELADVVQDTFVDVLQQLPSLREPELLRRWITGIAVHKVHRLAGSALLELALLAQLAGPWALDLRIASGYARGLGALSDGSRSATTHGIVLGISAGLSWGLR